MQRKKRLLKLLFPRQSKLQSKLSRLDAQLGRERVALEQFLKNDQLMFQNRGKNVSLMNADLLLAMLVTTRAVEILNRIAALTRVAMIGVVILSLVSDVRHLETTTTVVVSDRTTIDDRDTAEVGLAMMFALMEKTVLVTTVGIIPKVAREKTTVSSAMTEGMAKNDHRMAAHPLRVIDHEVKTANLIATVVDEGVVLGVREILWKLATIALMNEKTASIRTMCSPTGLIRKFKTFATCRRKVEKASSSMMMVVTVNQDVVVVVVVVVVRVGVGLTIFNRAVTNSPVPDMVAAVVVVDRAAGIVTVRAVQDAVVGGVVLKGVRISRGKIEETITTVVVISNEILAGHVVANGVSHQLVKLLRALSRACSRCIPRATAS